MMEGFPIPAHSLVQVALVLALVLASVPVLGGYMARVFGGEKTLLHPLIYPLERMFLKLMGVEPGEFMNWRQYAAAVIWLGIGGFSVLYVILRLQGFLPLNPQGFGHLTPDLAFNTAVSFVTNTNWQAYSGETTLSYFSQTAGLMVQQFISAATGMAVLMALSRGLSHRKSDHLGNFWVDVVRAVLYILLPLCLLFAIVLAASGVIQNYAAYITVETIDPAVPAQIIPGGPLAAFEAIKMLGTNGGGFFNANGAHPFENPNALSNIIQLWLMVVIPAALCYAHGTLVGDRRQGWAVLAAMLILLVGMLFTALLTEHIGNPRLDALGVDTDASHHHPGGNMEGKEMRFGISTSVLWSVETTATSCGAINSAQASFMPITHLVQLLLMQFGEVVLGGAGSGLYGMLMYVMLTVFVAGLMVGRTPELLGKKIGVFEMKMVALIILLPPVCVLIGTAIAVMLPEARAAMLNPGAHGLAEVLYAFTSAANNNGSAMAGLSANQPFYNYALGICMLIGRFWVMIALVALSGSLVTKQPVPKSAGTLPTHTPLFVILLIFNVVVLEVLTFVPVLALGPVVEHLSVWGGL